MFFQFFILDKLWLLSDDLRDNVASYKYKQPNCRPDEVHMLVWERESYLQIAANVAQLKQNDAEILKSSQSIKNEKMTVHEMSNIEENYPAISITTVSCSSASSSPLASPLVESPRLRSRKEKLSSSNIPRFKPYVSRSKQLQENLKTELELTHSPITEVPKNKHLLGVTSLSITSSNVASSVVNSPVYSGSTNEILNHVQDIFAQEFDNEEDVFDIINKVSPVCKNSKVNKITEFDNITERNKDAIKNTNANKTSKYNNFSSVFANSDNTKHFMSSTAISKVNEQNTLAINSLGAHTSSIIADYCQNISNKTNIETNNEDISQSSYDYENSNIPYDNKKSINHGVTDAMNNEAPAYNLDNFQTGDNFQANIFSLDNTLETENYGESLHDESFDLDQILMDS